MRTIIQIGQQEPGIDRASRLEGVADVNGVAVGADLDYPPEIPHDPEWINTLFAQIPGIMREIAYQPNGTASSPLYLADSTQSAQSLPWEAIAHNGDFLALGGARPIGRILERQPRDAVRREYHPPLRVMVVISAIGVSGMDEWDQIHAGLKSTSLEYELHAIVGEPDLYAKVEALKSAGEPVSVEYLFSEDSFVPRFDDMIRKRVVKFMPHVLHFFCHGRPRGNQTQLELATRSDHLNPNSTRGSALLGEEFFDLIQGGTNTIWLLVLNCCNGAVPKNGSSLVKKAVEKNFPAAVGMRAEIPARAASVFSGQLYRSFGAAVRNNLTPAGQAWEVDWATLLTAPRRLMYDQLDGSEPPEKKWDWTLPVLYVGRESFTLTLGESRPELQGYLETLRQTLEQSAGSATPFPPQALALIDAEILRVTRLLEAPV